MTIEQLEDYFSTTELPAYPVKINPYFTIIDCKKFVNSHIDIFKHNRDKKAFIGYYNRLVMLYEYLTLPDNV